jgi:hypothetical protein
MTQNVSGRKVGACTWQDPGIQVRQMQKQQENQKAAMCRDMIDKLQLHAVMGDQAICKEHREAFCARVGQVAQEMRDPIVFDKRIREHRDLSQVFAACGQDTNATWAAACTKAESTRNWTFVANYCEAQARQIALRECVGRQGTSVATFEYAPICMRYPPQRGQGQPAAPAASSPRQTGPAPVPPATQATPSLPAQTPPAASATPPVPAQQEPGMADKALEGLNKLKGLFGR